MSNENFQLKKKDYKENNQMENFQLKKKDYKEYNQMENDIFDIDQVEITSAIDGMYTKYEITGNNFDIPSYMSFVKDKVFEIIDNNLIDNNLKVQLVLIVSVYNVNYKNSNPVKKYQKNKKNDWENNFIRDQAYFFSKTEEIDKSTNLNDWYNKSRKNIKKSFSEYEGKGSGWKFMGIQNFEILITKVTYFGGSSYIDLPLEIKNKKACVNIQNNNQECFKYSILAALHYHEIKFNPERPSTYTKWLNELNFNGIDFPVKLKEIDTFEYQNPYRINVLGYENKEIYPLRISDKFSEGVVKNINDLTINLLLINDDRIRHGEKNSVGEKIIIMFG